MLAEDNLAAFVPRVPVPVYLDRQVTGILQSSEMIQLVVCLHVKRKL